MILLFWFGIPLAVVVGGAVLVAGFSRRRVRREEAGERVEYRPHWMTVFGVAIAVFAVPRLLLVFSIMGAVQNKQAMSGDVGMLGFFLAPEALYSVFVFGTWSYGPATTALILCSGAWAAALTGLAVGLRGWRERSYSRSAAARG